MKGWGNERERKSVRLAAAKILAEGGDLDQAVLTCLSFSAFRRLTFISGFCDEPITGLALVHGTSAGSSG